VISLKLVTAPKYSIVFCLQATHCFCASAETRPIKFGTRKKTSQLCLLCACLKQMSNSPSSSFSQAQCRTCCCAVSSFTMLECAAGAIWRPSDNTVGGSETSYMSYRGQFGSVTRRQFPATLCARVSRNRVLAILCGRSQR
jgi:hypothetical protein